MLFKTCPNGNGNTHLIVNGRISIVLLNASTILFFIKHLVRVKFLSIIIFININLLLLLLLLQSPQRARASTAISQMRPNIYIKGLDSTGLERYR
jgi:hypothetical protein